MPVCIDAAAVLDRLGMGVLVADRQGAILYRNAEADHLLGNGADLQSLLGVARFATESQWRVNVARVLSSRCEMQWTAPMIADPSRSLRIRCAPLQGDTAQNAVILYLECGRNTDWNDEHDVARRLTSLGKLAARVAHELNNPLDGILRYINLAMRVAGDGSESRLTSYLSESRSGLMRMIRIIGDLLEFSRNSDAGFEEASINELIEQAIKTCSASSEASRVIITADFQSDQMPKVRGGRLYQVCCNLMRNAIDAMPDGGRLSITSGLFDDCVVIRVTDTGVGLPDPVEKVFEPFYTTKQPGKGTGLGLAICKEFVEDMHGTISAANAESGGAVFTVRIPVTGLLAPQRITHS